MKIQWRNRFPRVVSPEKSEETWTNGDGEEEVFGKVTTVLIVAWV